MHISAGFRRFGAALAHWGIREYLLLGAFWLTLSTPLYVLGWGIASVASLPLFVLMVAALTYALTALVKPVPRHIAQPRPGFPESLDAATLGNFPLSAYSDSRYERSIDWCGAPVQLSLTVDSVESVDAVLVVAASLTATSSKVNAEVAKFVTKELLPSINEERLAAGSAALAPEELLGVITLQMITVNPDETYEFLYDDGDLLGGHWIEIHGSLSQGPIEVDMPG